MIDYDYWQLTLLLYLSMMALGHMMRVTDRNRKHTESEYSASFFAGGISCGLVIALVVVLSFQGYRPEANRNEWLEGWSAVLGMIYLIAYWYVAYNRPTPFNWRWLLRLIGLGVCLLSFPYATEVVRGWS